MKKIIPIIVLIILIITSLFYGNKLTNNNKLASHESTNDNNKLLAIYINGTLSSTFPTTSNYAASVQCLDSDGEQSQASGTATWNGNKWVVEFYDILEDGINCSVYFSNPEPKGWNNSESNTLLYALGSRLINYSATTTPGVDIASSDEGLRAAPDDYGTSYYFRGSVNNNFVVFANMCWRIVRVTGDGSVKLTLYNYNADAVSNPCSGTQNNGPWGLVHDENNTYRFGFNNTKNRKTYGGYMYSNTPDSLDIDIALANDNDSAALSILKDWYDEKLRDYNNLLADVIWCNDKSIVTDATYDPDSIGILTPNAVGTNNVYFAGTKRLYPTSSASPSLICPAFGKDGKLSKFTARDTVNGNAKLYSNNKEYKIGLLTADEAAFAGDIVGTRNTNCYLTNNMRTSSWTLTPAYFDSSGMDNWSLYTLGYHDNTWPVDTTFGLRPTIALKSDVTLKNVVVQDGTSDHPFIVAGS